MVRRKSTTVYLDQDVLLNLRRISMESGVPMATIIRRGVDMAIADMIGRAMSAELKRHGLAK